MIARAVLGGCAVAATLLPAPGAQRAVPVDSEPRHHVVYVDARAKVIDAVLPAGDVTMFHTHARDNVPVAVEGGRIRTDVVGGTTTESEVKTGAVSFAAGGYTHRIANIGPGRMRFIDVELLTPADAPTGDAEALRVPGLDLELENARVRIYRARLEPGASIGPHTHATAAVWVSVGGGRAAIGRVTHDLAPGAYGWAAAGAPHAIRNTGTSPVELVEIDWR
jgi:quercetin dioxygenase-like cupin family protein